jgi:hypothetical protein
MKIISAFLFLILSVSQASVTDQNRSNKCTAISSKIKIEINCSNSSKCTLNNESLSNSKSKTISELILKFQTPEVQEVKEIFGADQSIFTIQCGTIKKDVGYLASSSCILIEPSDVKCGPVKLDSAHQLLAQLLEKP